MENAFCHLTHYGFIRASGPDAKTFLQGQLTCDLNQATPSHSLLGTSCNIKGRIIALFQLAMENDNAYLLRLPLEVVPLLLEHLNKFALFSKVELSDCSKEFNCIGLLGNNSPNCFSTETPALNQVIRLPKGWLIQVNSLLPSHELWLKKESAEEAIEQLKQTVSETDTSQWELAQIQTGKPEVYAATSAAFTPHELNLPELGGVHFDKGCYQGQEVIARMHYRGKLKQHLYKGSLAKPITICPNDKLVVEGSTAGYVVRYCQTENSTELLATCKDKALENGKIYLADQLVKFIQS